MESKEPLLPLSSGHQKSSRMRGGPKLVCSPYFVLGLIGLLTLVSMRYWSYSSQNSELTVKIRDLQEHLTRSQHRIDEVTQKLQAKTDESDHMMRVRHEAEGNLKEAKDLAVSLGNQLKTAKNEAEEFERRFKDSEREKERYMEEKTKCTDREVARTLQTNEQVDKMKSRVAELERQLEQANAEALAEKRRADAALEDNANKKEESPAGRSDVQVGEAPDKKLGETVPVKKDGELEPVNPRAVHVSDKAVKGMRYHKDAAGRFLPILPQVPPDADRKKPDFSVFQKHGNNTEPAGEVHKEALAQKEDENKGVVPAPPAPKEDPQVRRSEQPSVVIKGGDDASDAKPGHEPDPKEAVLLPPKQLQEKPLAVPAKEAAAAADIAADARKAYEDNNDNEDKGEDDDDDDGDEDENAAVKDSAA